MVISFCRRPFHASALVLVTSVLFARTSSAQAPASTFDELSARLRLADRVVVSAGDGPAVKGRFLSLSDAALRVASDGAVREFRLADVNRIDRVSPDGLKNGILWGLVAGLGASFLAWPLTANHIKIDDADTSAVVGLYVIPAVGAAAGAAIDASITTAVPVYVRPRIVLTLSTPPGGRSPIVGARLTF